MPAFISPLAPAPLAASASPILTASFVLSPPPAAPRARRLTREFLGEQLGAPQQRAATTFSSACRFRLSSSAVASARGLGESVASASTTVNVHPIKELPNVDVALVWFRHDLRVHDHPALVAAAAKAKAVVPVYIFDPRATADGLPPPSLLEVVADLRASLRALGSELLVRTGSPEELLPALAAEAGAGALLCHEELPHRDLETRRRVSAALAERGVRLYAYRSCLREIPGTAGVQDGRMPEKRLPDNYRDYKRFVAAYKPGRPLEAPGAAGFERRSGLEVPGGEAAALAELERFLEHGESEGRTAFPRHFSTAIAHGCLSPRQIYAAARRCERRRGYPFGVSLATVASALQAAERHDFHARAAAQRAALEPQRVRYWRWRGFLVNYVCAGSTGPAILLVHGFGASVGHWRRNIADLATDHRVFALDLLGFGRSEKPELGGGGGGYGQDLWVPLVGDFLREVVREPALVAGNSIGGYVAMSAAADFKELVRGVALLNTAGPLLPPGSPEAPGEAAPNVFARSRRLTDAVAWGIFQYLLRSVEKTLVRVYPRNPAAADARLAAEIKRDALDPGATGVLAAGFTLPKPRTINALVAASEAPVMVLQGEHDPLNDARGRAERLAAVLGERGELHLLDAGHCPHDERPELVNPLLRAFSLSHPAPSTAESG
eukprot:tig00001094_g6998.t1